MKMILSVTEAVGAIEPTFEAQSGWRGQWVLGGRPACLRADADWLDAWIPICGEAGTMLARQHDLAGLAKVAAGDYLRAEMPIGRGDCADVFRSLRAELERGLDHFEGVPGADVSDPMTEQEVAECLAATGFTWSPKGRTFSTPLDDDPAPSCFATAESVGSALAIRATLSRLQKPGPESMAALTHFLLVLNGRIRLARASIAPDRIVLEAMLPPACRKPAVVNEAIRSLWIGAAAARRECAALLDPKIAAAYLQFHLKGANV